MRDAVGRVKIKRMKKTCQLQFNYDLNFSSPQENEDFQKELKDWMNHRDGDIGQIQEVNSYQWLISCENEEKRDMALHTLMSCLEPENLVFHEGDLRKTSSKYFYYEIEIDNKKIFEGTYVFE